MCLHFTEKSTGLFFIRGLYRLERLSAKFLNGKLVLLYVFFHLQQFNSEKASIIKGKNLFPIGCEIPGKINEISTCKYL